MSAPQYIYKVSLLCAVGAVLLSVFAWPFSLGRPVFRHADEAIYAIRARRGLADAMLMGPWPTYSPDKSQLLNNHPIYSTWIALRMASLLGIGNPDMLVQFLRTLSKVTLVVAGILICWQLIGMAGIQNNARLAATLVWGTYLGLDPGLAHLKPLVSVLVGEGANGYFVGFDRFVSPSLDIIWFGLAVWSILRLVSTPLMPWWQAISHAALMAFLLLLSPFYLITFAAATAITGLCAFLIPPRCSYAQLIPYKRLLPLAALGALIPLCIFVWKLLALNSEGVLNDLFARMEMPRTRALDFTIFQRTLPVLISLAMISLALFKIRKANRFLVAIPLSWPFVFASCYNHQFLTGRLLQNYHFDWPLGFLLGVSLVSLACCYFRRYIVMVGLVALLAAAVSHVSVSAAQKLRFEREMSGSAFSPPVDARLIDTAKQVVAAVGLEKAFFMSTEHLELPLQYVSSWSTLTPFLMYIYPYSPGRIWQQFVLRARLTGEPVESVFYENNPTPDVSSWHFGLPPDASAPCDWFKPTRDKFLPICRAEARRAYETLWFYSDPLPLVVITPREVVSPETDPPPTRETSVDGFSVRIYTTPFTIKPNPDKMLQIK